MSACDVLVIDDVPVARHAVRRVREANGLRIAGAGDFLAQPCEARELMECVRHALTGPADAKEEHP